jgi:hypothetical protein
VNPLYDVVWREYLRADKNRVAILRASAAWLHTPFPVQSIKGTS